jgi:hypothetical protein
MALKAGADSMSPGIKPAPLPCISGMIDMLTGLAIWSGVI